MSWDKNEDYAYYKIPGTELVMHVNMELEKERYQLFMPLLKKYGKLWSKMEFPPQYKAPLGERCFDAAMALSKKHPELLYCEGLLMAVFDEKTGGGFVSMAHAWCIDRSGRVIDPALPHASKYEVIQYYGLLINPQWHEKWKEVAGYYGALDGHPMLTAFGVHHEPAENWVLPI